MRGLAPFEQKVRSYLHFCRTEKGLALNSLESYRRDLAQFGSYLNGQPILGVTPSELCGATSTISGRRVWRTVRLHAK